MMRGVAPVALGSEAGTATNGTSRAPDGIEAVSAVGHREESGASAQAVRQPEQGSARSPAELISPPLPSFEDLMEDAVAVWRELMAVLRGFPGLLLVLAGVVLIWTRLLALEQGLWGEEIGTVAAYIQPGPHAILGHFTPNNQVLFGLLAWVSSALSGSHDAAAYRFWAVVPAIAAGALMTAWLWRRLDPWVAAIFAVLAAASPVYLDLGTVAQGYGLGFLSLTFMIVGADGFARRRSQRALLLFAAGALMGIWALPVMVPAFLGIAAVTMVHRVLRRPVIAAVGLVGGASLLLYAPLLGEVITSSSAWPGRRLPLHAALTGPLRDLLAPSVSLLLPNAAVGLDEVIAMVLLVGGLVLLWRAAERLLMLMLVVPVYLTYLCLVLGRFHVVDAFDRPAQLSVLDLTDRSTSFLVLPLLVGVAVALVGLGRLLAGTRVPRSWAEGLSGGALRDSVLGARPLMIPMVACAVVLVSLPLAKIDRLARRDAVVPLESYAEVGAIVKGTKIKRVLTNATHPAGLEYYIDPSARRITALSPAALEAMFCHSETGFIYIEVPGPAVDTACLELRRAVTVRVPERTAPQILVHILRGAPATATAQQVLGES
jgi:hypothetical protein